MMWSESGHVDHHTFAGVRGGGGGKGGGGGGQAPVPLQVFTDPKTGESWQDDPMRPGWAQQAQRNAIETRVNQEKEDSRLAKQAETDKAAAERTNFGTRNQAGYDYAMQNAVKAFQNAGVDPTQYMESDIIPTLMARKNKVQDMDPNPSAVYGDSIGAEIVNSVLGGKRTGATNQLNALFSPTYANTAYADTLPDQYVGSLVNEQFDPLAQQLTNANKRGTLNQQGYQSALDLLNQKKSTATSTVGNLGRDILTGYRGGLNDWIGQARTTAGGLSLADQFDPSVYQTGAQTRVASDIANFGGALRNKIGGTKFADISELINAGGAVQGSLNPNATNPTGGTIGGSPASAAQEELQKQKRGLGSTGDF